MTRFSSIRFLSALFLLSILLETSALAGNAASQPISAWNFLSQDTNPALQKITSPAKSQALPIQLNSSQMFDLPILGEIEINLPTATYTAVFERSEQHGDGIATWIGYLKKFGKDYRVIITRGPSGSFGSIRSPSGEFRLMPGNGQDWLVDMNQERLLSPPVSMVNDTVIPPKRDELPVRSDPKFVPVPAGTTSTAQMDSPLAQVFVDVMIVYTTGYANKLGPNLMTRLNSLVAATNQAYIDSQVAITLRLVKAVRVDYPDDTTDQAALFSITPGHQDFNAAIFGEIENQRTASGADLVAFLRDRYDPNSGSGIAWLLGTNPPPTFLYSITTGCTLGCDHVFAHELGHNMGNAHDQATAAWQAGGVATPPSGAYPYSFGSFYCSNGLSCDPYRPESSGGCRNSTMFFDGPQCTSYSTDNFGDIMSYFYPKLMRFSNPNTTCTTTNGPHPCGTAEANTALSMNNMRLTISGIKASTGTYQPGSLQFTSKALAATEATGALNFTVSRTGGSIGAVSVSYTTSDGSAIAGLDYVSRTGTLNWGDGDSADKTISIPLVNDGVVEGSESFTVTLYNPTGATGVDLGLIKSATGIIKETWPDPRFTSPNSSTSSPPWSVATDFSFGGGNSLKSGEIARLDANSFSATEFTGNFKSGQVAFAYKVSSLPDGPFEFSVDGVAVMTDYGDINWKYVTFPISAGTHTLRWKQTNTVGIPCIRGGFPGCADRAWIDAVVLPLALFESNTTLIASANPANIGQPITFTATVSSTSGTPIGNVTFMDGGATITGCSSVPVTSGKAECPTSGLSQGNHTITARYSGNVNYAPSTSAELTQGVYSVTRVQGNLSEVMPDDE